MKKNEFILLILLCCFCIRPVYSQHQQQPGQKGYMVPVCVYEGDTIPSITLRTVYVYPKIKFKNKKSYDRKAIAHKKKPSKESFYTVTAFLLYNKQVQKKR